MSPKVAHTRMKIQPTEWGKMPTIPILNKKKYMKKDFFHSCMISCFSCVGLFVTLWTVAHQAPLSMGFYRQKYQSGLPCPPPGIFLTQVPNLHLTSSALAGRFFTTSATWEAQYLTSRHWCPASVFQSHLY